MGHQEVDVRAQASGAHALAPSGEDQAGSNPRMDGASFAQRRRKERRDAKIAQRKIPKQQIDCVALAARLLEFHVQLNPALCELQRFFESRQIQSRPANRIVRNNQPAIRCAPDIEFDHVGAHFNRPLKRRQRILRRLRRRAAMGHHLHQRHADVLCAGLALPPPSFSSFSASSRMCCSCWLSKNASSTPVYCARITPLRSMNTRKGTSGRLSLGH